MSTAPAFASVPNVGAGIVSVADTSRTAPTSVTTIFTANPQKGSRIERISFNGLGVTTQTILRLWLYDGATYHLYQEVTIGPVSSPSATQPVFQGTLEAVSTPKLMPLVLPAGWSLRASINDAVSVKVIAIGGDF